MAEEIVKIIKIQTEDSERTVKGLKQEINDLRDALLNVEKGSDKYEEVLDALIKDEKELTSVMRAGKNEVHAAEGSYNALTQEMASLKKVWKEVTTEAERNKIGAQIKEINDRLKEYDESIGNNQRKVGSYEEALKTLNTHFASQRQELAALKVAMDNLDPSTEAYAQAFERAAEITHNLSERQEQLKYSTADVGDQLSNIQGIGANMAAGFSAINAAMGLFGSQNEDVAKALLKTQQMMALVQGMQGIDGFIKRTKGLSDAMKVWLRGTQAQTAALKTETTATKAQATATNVQATATNTATVAQKGLNAAMKANPIGLILGAVTLLISLLGPLSNLFDKITGKTQRMQESVDKTTAAMKAFDDSIKKLDEKHRLEQIEARLNGISDAQMRILRQDEATEKFNKGFSELQTTISEIYAEFERLGKVVDINIKTLEDWGFSEEQIQAILETTNNIVDTSAQAHEKANRKTIAHSDSIKRLMERLAEAAIVIRNYREEVKTLGDEETEENIAEADRARSIAKNATDSLKSQKQRLTEQYKEEKALLEKYNIDTTNLTKKYYKDLAALAKKGGKEMVSETDKYLKEMEEKYKEWVNTINSNNASSGYLSWLNQYKEALTTYGEGLDVIKQKVQNKDFAEILDEQLKAVTATINSLPGDMEMMITDMSNLIRTSSGNELGPIFEILFPKQGYTELLKDKSGEFVDEFYDEFVTQFLQAGNSGDELNAVILSVGVELQKRRMEKTYELLAGQADENSKKIAEKLNDATVQLFKNKLQPTLQQQVNKLQQELDTQTLDIDFQIDYGSENLENLEVSKVEKQYANVTEQLQLQLDYYNQIIDYVEKNGLLPSKEYEDAKNMITDLSLKLNQAEVNRQKSLSAIRTKYFKEDIEETKSHYEELQHIIENSQNRENNTGSFWKLLSPLDPKKEIEQINELYNTQMKGLVKIRDKWKDRLEQSGLTNDEKIEAEQALAQAEMDIADATLQHDMEVSNKRKDIYLDWVANVSDTIGAIGDLYGSLADYYEADIEAKVKAGELSEEQADKEFKSVKNMRIAEAVLNTIAGSVGTFMQAVATYAPPWGEIIGGISAAAVAASGAAQIAKIKSTDRNSGSSSAAAVTAPTTEVIPQYSYNVTNQQDTDYLRNAVVDGMAQTQLYVSVTDIDNVQNKVKVVDQESTF